MGKTYYKIIFHFTQGPSETYNGKSYIKNGEKMAGFCSWEPKLFKSEFQAEKTAKRLLDQCINCSEYFERYEIVPVAEGEITNWARF